MRTQIAQTQQRELPRSTPGMGQKKHDTEGDKVNLR